MILEDSNNVPFYIDEKHIILINLSGMQSPDSPEELPQPQRVAQTLFFVNFHLTFGLVQTIVFNKPQYDKLWERVKNEFT